MMLMMLMMMMAMIIPQHLPLSLTLTLNFVLSLNFLQGSLLKRYVLCPAVNEAIWKTSILSMLDAMCKTGYVPIAAILDRLAIGWIQLVSNETW